MERLSAAFEKFVNSAEISELLRQGAEALTALTTKWLPLLIQAFPKILISLEQIRSLFGQGVGQKLATNLLNNPQFMSLFSGFERGENGKINIKKGIAQLFVGGATQGSIVETIGNKLKQRGATEQETEISEVDQQIVQAEKQQRIQQIQAEQEEISQKRADAETQLQVATQRRTDLEEEVLDIRSDITSSEFDYSDEHSSFLDALEQKETEIKNLIEQEKTLKEQVVELANEEVELERRKNQEAGQTSQQTTQADEAAARQQRIQKIQAGQDEIKQKRATAEQQLGDVARRRADLEQEALDMRSDIAGSEFDYSDEHAAFLDSLEQKELEIKNLAEQEKTLKEQVVKLSEEEKELENLRKQETEQEKLNAEAVTRESREQVAAAQQETNIEKSGGTAGKGMTGQPGQKQLSAQTSSAIAGVTYAVGQLAQGVSSYTTAGVTHPNAYDSDQRVSSSEEARATSRAINTVFATVIPMIGTFLGSLIGDYFAKEIDKARDLANRQVKQAETVISTISKAQENFATIKELYKSIDPKDFAALNNAVGDYLAEIYTSDNVETRELLQKELNKLYNGENEGNLSLQQVIKDTTSDNIQTREKAIRHLEIAQKKVLLEQQRQASIAERLTYEQAINKKFNAYEKTQQEFDKNQAKALAAGVGAGVGTTAAVGGAATTLMAVGGALSATGGALPVGVVLALIGAGLAAAGSGALVGTAVGQSTYALLESKITDEKWNNADLEGKYALLEKDEARILQYLDNNDDSNSKTYKILQEQLTAVRELKNSVADYQSYIQNQIDAENKQVIETALLSARRNYGVAEQEDVGAQYLTTMTIGQLKNMSLTDIYASVAKAIADDRDLDLTQMYAYYTDSTTGKQQLSDQFIKLVTQVIQSQDEEIAAVLSGEAYTLNEALKRFGGSAEKLEAQQLKNFAYALGVAIDETDKLEESLTIKAKRFGELTLGEINKTTSEQIELSKSYTDVMELMMNSETSWLEVTQKIITEFPTLIEYMDDTPTLMEKIVQRLGQINELMLDSVWNDYKNENKYYTDVYKPLLQEAIKEVEDEKIRQSLLDLSENFYSLANLETYLAGFDRDALLSETLIDNLSDSELVAKSLFQIVEDIGSQETITADGLVSVIKKATDVAIKYEQRELDNLNAQKEALENITKQREYEVNLIKAKLQLEDALNNKARVYRAGIGFVYEANQEKIDEAQKNLEEVQRTKEISELTLQASVIQENIDRLNRFWQNREDEADQAMVGNIYDLLSGKDPTGNTVFDQVVDATDGISTTIKDALNSDIIAQQIERALLVKEFEDAYTDYYKLSQDETAPKEEVNSAAVRLREIFDRLQNKGYVNNESYNNWSGTDPSQVGSKASREILNSNALLRNPSEYNILDKKTGKLMSLNYSESGFTTSNTELAENMAANYKKVTVYSGDSAVSGGKNWENSELPKLKEDEDLFKFAKRLYEEEKDENSYILQYEGKRLLIKKGQVFDLSGVSTPENIILAGVTNLEKNKKLINFIDETGHAYPIDVGTLAEQLGIGINETYKKVWELSDKTIKYFSDPDAVGQWFKFNDDGSFDLITGDVEQQMTTAGVYVWGRLADNETSRAIARARKTESENRQGKINQIFESMRQNLTEQGKTVDQESLDYINRQLHDKTADELNEDYIKYVLVPYFRDKGITIDDEIKAIISKVPLGSGALEQMLRQAESKGEYEKIHRMYLQKVQPTVPYASGIYATHKYGYGLINELGTEAIITPSGTITALPSHTGIVPADITRNLWELGELAPSISRIIDAVSPMINTVPNSLANNSEEYFDIHSITINADETFDAEAFVAAIKSRALLTKNMH